MRQKAKHIERHAARLTKGKWEERSKENLTARVDNSMKRRRVIPPCH